MVLQNYTASQDRKVIHCVAGERHITHWSCSLINQSCFHQQWDVTV